MDQLELARQLFVALASAGIDYVHWKSNEHLDDSLRGATDLDLLVPERNETAFRTVIDDMGFVPMAAPWERRVPGTESYLGFDADTGTLVHLDVCFSLAMGERLLKNHRFPVEEWLLADPVARRGVSTPEPEKELLLLYVRSMLKTAPRQLLRSRLRGGSPLPHRIRTELSWLVDQVDPSRLDQVAVSSDLPIATDELAELCERVRNERLDLGYVRRLRSSLRRRLEPYERLPRHRAIPKRWWLRLRTSSWMGVIGLGIPPRNLTRGLLIAVVGADGAGKSRLTRDLESWLAPKLAVRHIYFGQPKSGFWFKLLNKPGSVSRRDDSRTAVAGLARYTDAAKWMLLGRRRRMMSTKARRMATGGIVAIAERFPLAEFQAMETPMDGPRLHADPTAPSSWARFERSQYEGVAQPDLLLILTTDLATLRDRKLDLEVDEHRAKAEAVQSLQPGPGRVIIDAGAAYEQVLLEAKTATWEAISAAN